jgi:hypothetical protein
MIFELRRDPNDAEVPALARLVRSVDGGSCRSGARGAPPAE